MTHISSSSSPSRTRRLILKFLVAPPLSRAPWISRPPDSSTLLYRVRPLTQAVDWINPMPLSPPSERFMQKVSRSLLFRKITSPALHSQSSWASSAGRNGNTRLLRSRNRAFTKPYLIEQILLVWRVRRCPFSIRNQNLQTNRSPA